jgi:hypothetical protein
MTLFSVLTGALALMTTPSPVQPVPFDSGRWRLSAAEHRVENHLGRQSLYLKDGIATVADVRFTNGWIEFDIAFAAGRGFMGGIWRVEDASNYEEFYLRPHQSGNPDATQYSPVFHGISGWQLYHGPRYSVPLVHRFDEWTRVRILFSGEQAEIYVGDLEKPALQVDRLKRSAGPGGVGLSVGEFSPAWYSNFSYAETDSPPLKGRPGPPESAPPGIIPSWRVSDPFPESALESKITLGREDLAARSWTLLETESSGLANLARVHGIEDGRDTVFARKVFHSGREQIQRLDIGFSDRVRVYLNGRLLFRGADSYQSRDYRFLGSIGYFDALYLPLVEGENELVLAVTEGEVQGGWGIQAKLENLTNLHLKD